MKLIFVLVGVVLSCNAFAQRTHEIKQGRNGHFYVDGFIGESPSSSIRWIIDTGASGVTVPRSVMNRAGEYGRQCKWINHQTANGVIQMCHERIDVISFGSFRMRDVSVAITTDESVGNTGLLGMEVLRYFRIEIDNGVMRLTSK